MKHLIKWALFLLAAVAAYYVYKFTALVADYWIAVLAAGSLVGTYIGLAFADIPPTRRAGSRWVALTAMGIEALYGTLYVLSVQSPELFAPPLSYWLSVPLALLHGAAFSVLAFFVTLFVTEAPQADELPARDRALIAALQALVPQLPAPQVVYPRPQEVATMPEAAALPVAAGTSGTRSCPTCGKDVPVRASHEAGTLARYGCQECRAKRKAGKE